MIYYAQSYDNNNNHNKNERSGFDCIKIFHNIIILDANA